MTEPTAEAVTLTELIEDVFDEHGFNDLEAFGIVGGLIDQALQAERDRERDAIVAWIKSGSGPYVEGYAEAYADLIADNQHRSAEHG